PTDIHSLSLHDALPISLIYALRAHRPLSRRLPLVILQQAAQSFSTPHCSHLPCYFLPASAKETRSDCLCLGPHNDSYHRERGARDRKSTRLNSSHLVIS